MNLNTASISTMAKLVGLECAYDLSLWRPFLSWADVERVPGFTAAQVEHLRRAGVHVKLPGEPLTRREALDASYRSIDRNVGDDRRASL